ncbi:hypothetical protein AB0B30_20065 [Streptomyces narbonensis]|uniref:Uncharacterized protein n=1 Tax=Streptomyces narbonensis TaxID=67333 RepID=A0ABV3CD86_9ACTN
MTTWPVSSRSSHGTSTTWFPRPCTGSAERAVQGRFDAAVSVEMIEAVEAEFRPAYFASLRRLLAPGGRIGRPDAPAPSRY